MPVPLVENTASHLGAINPASLLRADGQGGKHETSADHQHLHVGVVLDSACIGVPARFTEKARGVLELSNRRWAHVLVCGQKDDFEVVVTLAGGSSAV